MKTNLIHEIVSWLWNETFLHHHAERAWILYPRSDEIKRELRPGTMHAERGNCCCTHTGEKWLLLHPYRWKVMTNDCEEERAVSSSHEQRVAIQDNSGPTGVNSRPCYRSRTSRSSVLRASCTCLRVLIFKRQHRRVE